MKVIKRGNDPVSKFLEIAFQERGIKHEPKSLLFTCPKCGCVTITYTESDNLAVDWEMTNEGIKITGYIIECPICAERLRLSADA